MLGPVDVEPGPELPFALAPLLVSMIPCPIRPTPCCMRFETSSAASAIACPNAASSYPWRR